MERIRNTLEKRVRKSKVKSVKTVPSKPSKTIPSKTTREIPKWRQDILKRIDLDEIYGEWLTGKQNGEWMECRDPESPSGDQNPSAGVADGSGEIERGWFKSFRNETRSFSVFDFLVERGIAKDFWNAVRYLAEKTGVKVNEKDIEIEKVVEDLNEEYAVSYLGNNAVVLHDTYDYQNNCKCVKTLKTSNFKLYLQNHQIQHKNKSISAADIWLKNPNRRTYKQAIFLPNGQQPECFNF